MDFNKVLLIGRLGKDPELVQNNSITTIVKFSVATTSTYKDKDGRTNSSTEWHNIKAFGRVAEICMEYAKKGQLVHIEGRLSSYRYDSNGINQKHVEVIADGVNILSSNMSFKGEDIPF